MKIALVGNQNCGKTSMFNLLTGMNQKIGNWPGVTLERKSGIINGTRHELIDLPGIYSLVPYTMEEKISCNFLVESDVELIINVVDVTSIERGIYLTTQLLDLDVNVILVLNMMDRLEQKGIVIDVDMLEKELGISVCMVSALKEKGINELVELIDSKKFKVNSLKNVFSRDVEEAISSVIYRCKSRSNKRFEAIQLLENSEDSFARNVRCKLLNKHNMDFCEYSNGSNYNIDFYEYLIECRYKFISDICERCIKVVKKAKNISYFLDKIFLNKFFAIPFFLFFMFLVYFLSVGVVGKFTSEIMSNSVSGLKMFFENFLFSIGVSDWIISLICDAIITGVGSVLVFLPQLFILFICISILESTGYMARISFLLDKIFKKIGLSGKSLIPFIVGSGCSVSGIMSSRIVENERGRKLTACVTSFIPCTAKLPIITLFSSYFFSDNRVFVSVSFYVLSILLIIVSLLIINKFINNKSFSPYISELPEYKMPSIKYIARDVVEKVKEFVVKAGTIIFLSSLCVWFLLSFSTNLEYGVDISKSILAGVGKKFSRFFYPILGQNSWEISVSAIQGLIAKEQVVSSMEIISGFSSETKSSFEIFGTGGPFDFFNKASSYAFVAFNLFSAPCISAIASLKKELGSFRMVFLCVMVQTLLAWVVSVLLSNVLSVLF